MNLFRRAVLYITRKRARTILLLLLLASMALLMLASLSVRASAQQAAEEVRTSMTSGFSIDIKQMPGDQIYALHTNEKGELVREMKLRMLTKEGVDQILALDGVKGFYGGDETDTLYTGLDVVPGGFTEGYRALLASEPTVDPEEQLSYESNMKSSTLLGVTDSRWHPFFVNGALELTEGRPIMDGDRQKALVSDELARRNGLSLGDTVIGLQFDPVTGERYSSPYEVEVVGIFHANFSQDLSAWTSEADIVENCIFTDPGIGPWRKAEYAKHYGGQVVVDAVPSYGQAVFYVDDPALLDAVMERVHALDVVDWEYYTVQREDDDYQTAAGPLQTMANLSSGLVVIAAAGSLAVLSLLITMWVRGRRREVGILTAAGIGRGAVLLQLLLECLLIACAAFLLAAIAAGPLTEWMGNALAGAASPAAGAQPFDVSVEPGTGAIRIAKVSNEPIALPYQVGWGEALGALAAMAGVLAAAVLIAARSVTRLKPREIIQKR